MTQESLDFGRLYRVTDSTRSLYRAMNDAVDVLGIVTAAGACGIDRADLRRALDREGRRVAVEHAMAIAACSTSSFRERVASAFISPLDFELSDARPPMSHEDRANLAESVLHALGPIAQEAWRQALGARR
jgi:hypothetical protein